MDSNPPSGPAGGQVKTTVAHTCKGAGSSCLWRPSQGGSAQVVFLQQAQQGAVTTRRWQVL